jgi:enoyl-CoA hydratase/carnithine racemase
MFSIDHVVRRDEGDVAILTIRRPRVLNALNDEVYAQLTNHFTALKEDPRISAVVLTGFGTKAFVSGADVNFLARITSTEQGFTTSERSKTGKSHRALWQAGRLRAQRHTGRRQ